MLNQDKVKYMTKAAAYEDGPEKKNIGISHFYRADYLGLQMVKAAVAYTVAFVILVVLWAMGRLEELMLLVSRADYMESLIKILILLYVSGMIVYEGIIYAYFSDRFRRAKNSVKGFYRHLKKIDKIYETQKTADTGETDDESQKNEDVEI